MSTNWSEVIEPHDVVTPSALLVWFQERYDNCLRIAAQKTGQDRQVWLDAAAYFEAAIQIVPAEQRESGKPGGRE